MTSCWYFSRPATTACVTEPKLRDKQTSTYPLKMVCQACHKMLMKFMDFKKMVENSVIQLNATISSQQINRPACYLQHGPIEIASAIDSQPMQVFTISNDAFTDSIQDSSNDVVPIENIKVELIEFDDDDDMPLVNAAPKHSAKKARSKISEKSPQDDQVRLITLTKEEILKEKELARQKESYLKLPYRCDRCVVGFDYEENLKEHMEKRHTEGLPVLTEGYLTSLPSTSIEVEVTEQSSPIKLTQHVEDNDLYKLLQNNFEASGLLNFVGKSLENDTGRNLLASIISKQMLKENKNSPITSNVYNKWSEDIKILFPKERITTYYIPPCVTEQGVTLQARGKLVSQLMNTRRKYQKFGVLNSKERKIQIRNTSQASSSSRPFPVSVPIQNSNTEEDLAWLRSSFEPWSIVKLKWNNTLSVRSRNIRKPGCLIEQYFDEYPALQKPQGYELLIDDFNNSYPDHANNFHINFPAVKNKLLEILSKKATKIDHHARDLINFSKDSNEENRNLAAILSLPELIKSSVVVSIPSLSTSPSSSTDIPSAKKKKNDKKWKPTKVESRESFITHVQDKSYLKSVINKRHHKMREMGFTPQPYIVIIGANLFNIVSYLVIVNPEIIYDFPNILVAMDTCFKITWSLNLEYDPPSYGSWYFIQKGLYKLSGSFDKGSTSAESLMTDCNLTN